jgi:hypothetical protein
MPKEIIKKQNNPFVLGCFNHQNIANLYVIQACHMGTRAHNAMVSRHDDIHLEILNYCLFSSIEAQYLSSIVVVHHLHELK